MKRVTSKKGASIFEASFLLADSVKIYALSLNLRKDKSVTFEVGDSEFNTIIELMKSSEEITVFDSSNRAMMFSPDDDVRSKVETLAKSFIGKTDVLRNVFIYAGSVDETRALAREMRADKAVAKAAKKPAKPKAGIKTRKDVL